MKVRILLEALLYLLLLGFALEFCRIQILDFIDGGTGFTTREELISLIDLPTLTICLEVNCKPNDRIYHRDDCLVVDVNSKDGCQDAKCGSEPFPDLTYGEHFSVETKIVDKKNYEGARIDVDKNVILKTWEHNVHKLNNFKKLTWQAHSKCFAISPRWNGTENIRLGRFYVQVTLKLKEKNESVILVKRIDDIFVTSEENSFGFASDRWIDGWAQRVGRTWTRYEINSQHDFTRKKL